MREEMTNEELERYARLGIETDIKQKAMRLAAAVKELENLLSAASGIYVRSRFRGHHDSVTEAVVAFDEAMAKKESLGYGKIEVGT